MFHFNKKDLQKETGLIKKIIDYSQLGTVIIFCIQNVTKKLSILNSTIDFNGDIDRVLETSFLYQFKDKSTGHCSTTDYKLIAIKKIG